MQIWTWVLLLLALLAAAAAVAAWAVHHDARPVVHPGAHAPVTAAVAAPWDPAADTWPAGTRLLRNGEAAAADNGIYVKARDGAWARAPDLADPAEQGLTGNLVYDDAGACWWVLQKARVDGGLRFVRLLDMVHEPPPRTGGRHVWTDHGWAPWDDRGRADPAGPVQRATWTTAPRGMHAEQLRWPDARRRAAPVDLWVLYVYAHAPDGLVTHRFELLAVYNPDRKLCVTDHQVYASHKDRQAAAQQCRVRLVPEGDGWWTPLRALQVGVVLENGWAQQVPCGLYLTHG